MNKIQENMSVKQAVGKIRQYFFSGKGYDLPEDVSNALQNMITIFSSYAYMYESRLQETEKMPIRDILNVMKGFLFSGKAEELLPEDVEEAVQSLVLKMSRLPIFEATKYKHYRDEIPVTEVDTDVNKNIPNPTVFRAYKQFATHYDPKDPTTSASKGLLYPLYIGADKGIQVGKWYRCGEGELAVKVDDSGEPVLKDGKLQIKVKTSNGKLGGTLSYRPGWHLGSAPVTRHIGVPKDVNGKSLMSGKEYDYMRPECVWAEVEYSAQRDYTDDTPKTLVKSGNNKGQVDRRKACFDSADKFKDGFYHYQTNNNANSDEDWLIANAIKVIKVLSDEEVQAIAEKHGLKAQLRDIEKTGGAFIADIKQFSESRIREDKSDDSKGYFTQKGKEYYFRFTDAQKGYNIKLYERLGRSLWQRVADEWVAIGKPSLELLMYGEYDVPYTLQFINCNPRISYHSEPRKGNEWKEDNEHTDWSTTREDLEKGRGQIFIDFAESIKGDNMERNRLREGAGAGYRLHVSFKLDDFVLDPIHFDYSTNRASGKFTATIKEDYSDFVAQGNDWYAKDSVLMKGKASGTFEINHETFSEDAREESQDVLEELKEYLQDCIFTTSIVYGAGWGFEVPEDGIFQLEGDSTEYNFAPVARESGDTGDICVMKMEIDSQEMANAISIAHDKRYDESDGEESDNEEYLESTNMKRNGLKESNEGYLIPFNKFFKQAGITDSERLDDFYNWLPGWMGNFDRNTYGLEPDFLMRYYNKYTQEKGINSQITKNENNGHQIQKESTNMKRIKDMRNLKEYTGRDNSYVELSVDYDAFSECLQGLGPAASYTTPIDYDNDDRMTGIPEISPDAFLEAAEASVKDRIVTILGIEDTRTQERYARDELHLKVSFETELDSNTIRAKLEDFTGSDSAVEGYDGFSQICDALDILESYRGDKLESIKDEYSYTDNAITAMLGCIIARVSIKPVLNESIKRYSNLRESRKDIKDMPCVVTEEGDILWTDPEEFENVVLGIFTASSLGFGNDKDIDPRSKEFTDEYKDVKSCYKSSGFEFVNERDTADSYRKTTVLEAMGLEPSQVKSITAIGNTFFVKLTKPLRENELDSEYRGFFKKHTWVSPTEIEFSFYDFALNPDFNYYYHNFMK